MSNERIILCEACQSEGRLYTSNGGPDETDNGPCPWCDATGMAVIKTALIELDDLEDAYG